MDPMKHALANRRGKGVDIHIVLGGPDKGKEDEQSTDLAPAPKNPAHPDEAQDKSLIDKMIAEHEAMEGSENEEQVANDDQGTHEAMLASMSDYDKEALMAKKPKSLGERARHAALMKGKK